MRKSEKTIGAVVGSARPEYEVILLSDAAIIDEWDGLVWFGG
jgi:hypothetical protein